MADKTHLVLEDGSVFEGQAFGATAPTYGEVVFNTSMTGYQEILTDPSYSGQIVVLTYPLIGNYGVNPSDIESKKVQVSGLVVRRHSTRPSHWESTTTLSEYLKAQGVSGISEVDTRAITRRLRTSGVMMGTFTLGEETAQEAGERLKRLPRYDERDYVRQVSTAQAYDWESPITVAEHPPAITVLDMGLKYNILRILRAKGCQVKVVPSWVTGEAILAGDPDGVVLSPGPGDPAQLEYVTRAVGGILGRVPVMGICLGHQVLAQALGGKTYKLKFGHRGGNHPVKDIETGRVHITAQNHGYAVDPESLPGNVEVSHINLNDHTVEGMRHRELPVMSIQYHSEASPGPLDSMYLFDRFLDMVRANPARRIRSEA
ncbi:MAG: carbamoyl-phosphate synthase small subunit [Dehalococcoidia bacterium]|nr:carbamoyl-phosphate synthase small subunit [Dehalococcoidia bacterium]